MTDIDPLHEFVHKVRITDWTRYMDYLVDEITSVCGKTWAPKRVLDTSKPKCPVCFPERDKFAVAA